MVCVCEQVQKGKGVVDSKKKKADLKEEKKKWRLQLHRVLCADLTNVVRCRSLQKEKRNIALHCCTSSFSLLLLLLLFFAFPCMRESGSRYNGKKKKN